MTSSLEVLKMMLADSVLSVEEQADFLWFLTRMPAQHIEDIIDMAKEDQNFIPFLWSNYRGKQKAFASNNMSLVEDVLKAEKVFLDEMNNEGI